MSDAIDTDLCLDWKLTIASKDFLSWKIACQNFINVVMSSLRSVPLRWGHSKQKLRTKIKERKPRNIFVLYSAFYPNKQKYERAVKIEISDNFFNIINNTVEY